MACLQVALLLLLALSSAAVLPREEDEMTNTASLPVARRLAGPLLERLLLQGPQDQGWDSADWRSPMTNARFELAKRNRLCFFSPVTCYK